MAAHSDAISAPYTVFPLSHPLTHQTRSNPKGEGHVRPCYMSLVESGSSKKRKRVSSEVAAAVDGEGVNIYDVAAGQIISSCATPPSTRFSCAPVSVRSALVRRTYAAVSHPRKQILGWEQSIVVGESEAGEEIVTPYTRNNDNKTDVVLLKDHSKLRKLRTKNTPGEGSVLVVHADAELKCFSSDLQVEKWSFKSQSAFGSSKKTTAIVFASTTPLSTARKAILKNRPDVIIRGTEDDLEDLVLLTISTTPTEPGCGIDLYLIPTSGSRTPSHLLTLTTSLEQTNDFPTAFTIHFPTGALHCITPGKLITYSLSTTVPSIVSTIPLPAPATAAARRSATAVENPYSLYSILKISPTSVLVSTPDDLSLYETKYSSLQARLSFPPPSFSSTVTSESKETVREKSLHLSVFIDNMGLALGYSHDGIKGVQLPNHEGRSATKTSGLLIDSICRGVDDLSVGDEVDSYTGTIKALGSIDTKRTQQDSYDTKYYKKYLKSRVLPKVNAEATAMRTAISELRGLRAEDDLLGFEKRFASYVGVERWDKKDTKDTICTETSWSWKRKNGDTSNETDVEMTNGIDSENSAKQISSISDLPEFITPKSQTYQTLRKEYPHEIAEFYWKPLSEKFVTEVLDMIFEVKKDTGRLAIAWFPPNVIKYLVESGNFSSTSIAIACQQQRQQWVKDGEEYSSTNVQLSIGRGELVECLIDYDPSLSHLAWFLREAGEMSIGEIIKAVKVVLERVNNNEKVLEEGPRLIGGPIDNDGDDDEDEERKLQRATLEAEQALERASSALEEKDVLEEVLRLAMRRLNGFPSGVIVSELKSGLGGEEVMSLIRILRKELVIDREGSDEHEGEVALEAGDVELVCDLLTCALDAVGIAGLILTNDTVMGQRRPGMNIGLDGELDLDDEDLYFLDPEDDGELLIDSLYSEVNKAVVALEEAAAISGLLYEVCRYGGGLPGITKHAKPTSKPKAKKKKKKKEPSALTSSRFNTSTISTALTTTHTAPSDMSAIPPVLKARLSRKGPTSAYLKAKRAARRELEALTKSPALSQIKRKPKPKVSKKKTPKFDTDPADLVIFNYRDKKHTSGKPAPVDYNALRNSLTTSTQPQIQHPQARLKNQNRSPTTAPPINKFKLPRRARRRAAAASKETAMLPLGLPPSKEKAKMKISSGGEVVQRSRREIEERRSMAVGVYSVEKLVL